MAYSTVAFQCKKIASPGSKQFRRIKHSIKRRFKRQDHRRRIPKQYGRETLLAIHAILLTVFPRYVQCMHFLMSCVSEIFSKITDILQSAIGISMYRYRVHYLFVLAVTFHWLFIPALVVCVFRLIFDIIGISWLYDESLDEGYFVLHPLFCRTSFCLGLPIYVGVLDAYYMFLIGRNILLLDQEGAIPQIKNVLQQLYLFSFTVRPHKLGIYCVYLRICRVNNTHRDCRFYFGRQHRLHHLHSFLARELNSTSFEIICPHEHSLNGLHASLEKLTDLDISNSFLLIFEGNADMHNLSSSPAQQPAPSSSRSDSLLNDTTTTDTLPPVIVRDTRRQLKLRINQSMPSSPPCSVTCPTTTPKSLIWNS